MRLFKIVFVILLITNIQRVSAQNGLRTSFDNTNAWIAYVGDHKVSDKWGVHLEFAFRRSQVLSKPMQLLPRFGVNYHFNNQLFASVGYAFVETESYGELPAKRNFPENRIWEQLQYKAQIGKLELINRFRLEQRYVQLPISETTLGDAIYTNRIRYMQRVSIPFKGEKIEDNSFYITAFDEVFINFGKNVQYNVFDQNRAFLGLGWKWPRIGRLELGYMNQWVLKSDGIKVENNHTIQLSLGSTIDFYKKEK